ncbi:hypothetical protein EBU58_13790 [bacterium]|nr:hypothetical protein [bacterium]
MDERMDACPSTLSSNTLNDGFVRRPLDSRQLLSAGLVVMLLWPGPLTAAEPQDPLAQAVIDSLRADRRTTPEELLEAVILASDVDAYELASEFLGQFVDVVAAMGDERESRLADLADLDPVGLIRTKRRLGALNPEAIDVLNAVQQASLRRYQDPAWLSEVSAGLSSPSSSERGKAFDILARAGIHAIPAAVEILNQPEPADEQARLGRALAWRLIHELGRPAREPLLNWLGSADVARWPGVILPHRE